MKKIFQQSIICGENITYDDTMEAINKEDCCYYRRSQDQVSEETTIDVLYYSPDRSYSEDSRKYRLTFNKQGLLIKAISFWNNIEEHLKYERRPIYYREDKSYEYELAGIDVFDPHVFRQNPEYPPIYTKFFHLDGSETTTEKRDGRETVYDKFGTVISMKEKNDYYTFYEYDSIGENRFVCKMKDSEGNEIEYDKNGKLKSINATGVDSRLIREISHLFVGINVKVGLD